MPKVLKVMWPLASLEGERIEDPNAGSIVTLLTYGDSTVLLTGDIGVEEELHLIPNMPQIDVLKVGHQGSQTSSAERFLRAIKPSYAVISVGENNYGHPHESVVNRLEDIGAFILRTDLNGDVRIVSDGGEPEVATFDL